MTWMQADTEHRKQRADGSGVANAWSKTETIACALKSKFRIAAQSVSIDF